ncbi:general substrate transporter, partial [Infundibulicybe gibba]
ACNSVSYVLFSFLRLVLIELVGRRKLMMWGTTGQYIRYIFITRLPACADSSTVGVTIFFLYYVFFNVRWQGVPWLYPTEINSLSMCTKGAALGAASNWYLSLSPPQFHFLSQDIQCDVVQITPPGIANPGWRFCLIWVVFNAAFVPLVWLIYPETVNRRIEDIDRLYQEDKSMIFVYDNLGATRVQ